MNKFTTEQQFMSSLDEDGRKAFTYLLKFAKEKSYHITWGVIGFSLNVMSNTGFIVLCLVYPPNCPLRKQSIYTRFEEIRRQVQNSGEIISYFKQNLNFIPFEKLKVGINYKWLINASFNERDMVNFCKILDDVRAKILQNTR